MKRSSGFTLIEVMVALAVFAISMSALISAMQNNVRSLEGLKNRTIAQWIATNQMVGYQSQGNFPKQGEKVEKIKFSGVDGEREWVMKIAVDNPMSKVLPIQQIHISVGEEIDKEQNYYATVDGYFDATK